MGIIRRPVRRLKDTFQYAKTYNETDELSNLIGRHVRTKKKLQHELPRSSNIQNNEHDAQQIKRKADLIKELQRFFENHDSCPQVNNLFSPKSNTNTKSTSSHFLHFYNFLHLLDNAFFSSTCFTICCLGTLLNKQRSLSIPHYLTHIFLRSLFLNTCLHFSSRKSHDIAFRLIISIFHLIVEYTIDFEKKPLL